MALPPATLNESLDHAQVLQALGAAVKPTLPFTGVCPLCGGVMTTYADPAGGAWYVCTSRCRFRGDSVQLYQRAKKIPEIPLTVQAMHTAGLTFRGGLPSPAAVSQYSATLMDRLQVDKFWEDATRLIYEETSLSPTFRSLESQYRLPFLNGTLTSATGVRQFIGGTTASMLANSSIASRLSEMPKLRGSLLVMPTYRLPGFISGLQFLGSGGVCHVNLKLPKDEIDSGLGMLDSVWPGDPVALAINVPLMGMHLQTFRLSSSKKPFPVVTWSDGSTVAWGSILAPKVVFWADDITLAMFMHAKQVNNAHIAQRPQLIEPITPATVHRLLANGESSLLATVFSTAIPFASCLKRYLFLKPGEAAGILEALDLSEMQKQALLSACRASSERADIRRWLNHAPVESTVFFNGRVVVEREAGYFAKPKTARDRELQISNVRLHQETATLFQKDDEVVIEGRLLAGDKSINFSVTEQQLKKDTSGWLTRLLLMNGAPYPMVARGWEKHLAPLSAMFHRPDARVGIEYAGWDGSRFVLPGFDIVDGNVEKRPRVCRDGVPGAKLRPSTKLDTRHLACVTGKGEHKVAFWALFACIMRNATAREFGWKVSTIGVVSSAEEHPVTAWASKAFGLREYVVDKKTTADTLLKLSSVDAFPLVVRVPADHGHMISEWMAAGLRANVIVRVTEAQARAGLLHAGWSFVAAKEEAADRLEGAESVFVPYLSLLQSCSYKLTSAGTPHATLLKSIQDWFEISFGGSDCAPIDQAADAVWTPDDVARVDGKFMDLMIWLLRNGFISGKAVEITDDTVTVSLKAVGKLLDSLKCPALPLDAVTAELASSKSLVSCEPASVVISRKSWDLRVRWFDEFYLADKGTAGA